MYYELLFFKSNYGYPYRWKYSTDHQYCGSCQGTLSLFKYRLKLNFVDIFIPKNTISADTAPFIILIDGDNFLIFFLFSSNRVTLVVFFWSSNQMIRKMGLLLKKIKYNEDYDYVLNFYYNSPLNCHSLKWKTYWKWPIPST